MPVALKFLKSHLLIPNTFSLIFNGAKCLKSSDCIDVCDTDKMIRYLVFSLFTAVLLTSIFCFLWNQILGRKFGPRKVTTASRLYPQLLGNKSQGKWCHVHGSERLQGRYAEVKGKEKSSSSHTSQTDIQGFQDQQRSSVFLPTSQQQ